MLNRDDGWWSNIAVLQNCHTATILRCSPSWLSSHNQPRPDHGSLHNHSAQSTLPMCTIFAMYLQVKIFAMYLKVQANICNVSTSAEYLPHICKCTILAVYLQVQDICNVQDLFSEQSRSLLPLSGPQPQASSSASVLELNFPTITQWGCHLCVFKYCCKYSFQFSHSAILGSLTNC